MVNLNVSAAGSLSTLNQWIGLINSNLTGTKKTGYKETRLTLGLGAPDEIGAAPGTTGFPISIPSSSLTIKQTEILDYVQGTLLQTQNQTDFGLNGKGYFVVEDSQGVRYATRDGSFRFDNDGYLVTSEGLRVLTSGQDYFRIPISENFVVDEYGKTTGIKGTDGRFQIVNEGDPNGLVFNPNGTIPGGIPPLIPPPGLRSYNLSKYGMKRLMVVNIEDSYKLHYSKYGSTKFDLGEYIPLRMDNDFSEDISILNLAESDLLNPFTGKINPNGNGFPVATGPNPTGKGSSVIGVLGGENREYFKHDTTNGVVRMSQRDSVYAKSLLTGHKLSSFQASADFSLRRDIGADSIQSFGFFFGQKEKYQLAQDTNFGQTTEYISFDNTTGLANHFNNTVPPAENQNVKNVNMRSGFWAGIFHDSVLGDQLMIQGEGTVKKINIPVGLNYDALNSTATANNYNLTLTANGNNVSVNLYDRNNNLIVSLGTSINIDLYKDGYVGIGNGARPTNSNNTAVDITRVHLHELDKSNYYDNVITGGDEKYRQAPGDQLETLGQASKLGTVVNQGYLEESTSSLSDALPMLSNIQKIFAAIAKIITVANSNIDDVNTLLR